MLYRQATLADIPQIQTVRRAVKENVLSDPALVTDAHCAEYLTRRGKGWVCEVDGSIVGFSIVSLADHNVWALFVHPHFEGRGIGKKLQQLMLQWYFGQTKETLWLGTEAQSRAAAFYRKTGWQEVGRHSNQELKFEMPFDVWKRRFQE